jgi:uncharacterized protein with HEPN domain
MKADVVFLKHILDEINFVLVATSGKTLADLQDDGTLQRACSRSIEIIGEAAKNISTPLRKASPHIPWKQLAAMRDKLIHQYFSINWVIVWDVIENHLPTLQSDIDKLVTTIETEKVRPSTVKENSNT